MPGSSDQIRIGKLAAQRHLTGSGIDRGAENRSVALVRIGLAVVENEPHPRGRDFLQRAGIELAPQLVELRGRLREVRIDRIELLNRGNVRGLF